MPRTTSPAAQIAAVRSFINQKVDAIVMAPIVEDGWDDVLKEALAAKIPVILEDRTVTAPDSTFASWVGTRLQEGGRDRRDVGQGAVRQHRHQDGRARGHHRLGAGERPCCRVRRSDRGSKIKKIDSQTGDFTRDGGKKVMEGFLQKYGADGIDLVFAHNDDMALGAIEAIEAAGAKPGEDIKIISIDAVKDGMQALIDGKINYIVECNPLLGELAAGLVKDVLAGKPVEKANYVKDDSFTKEQAAAVIDSRKY